MRFGSLSVYLSQVPGPLDRFVDLFQGSEMTHELMDYQGGGVQATGGSAGTAPQSRACADSTHRLAQWQAHTTPAGVRLAPARQVDVIKHGFCSLIVWYLPAACSHLHTTERLLVGCQVAADKLFAVLLHR